jgi:5-(carboxyamino)imidazole ribonucleotide mutase
MDAMKPLKVLVVMGSDSDFPVMEPCFKTLSDFGIEYEGVVCSAHRTPERAAELARSAGARGFGCLIAAAGLAAHLPGVLAAFTALPVIGIPVKTGALDGLDALLAIVQMPQGVPVATVAIDGAVNAAILAAQILATGNPALADKVMDYKAGLVRSVDERDRRLQAKLAEMRG